MIDVKEIGNDLRDTEIYLSKWVRKLHVWDITKMQTNFYKMLKKASVSRNNRSPHIQFIPTLCTSFSDELDE